MALTACGGTAEPVATTAPPSPSETPTPVEYRLDITLVDQVPLNLAMNSDDVECYPTAATVGAGKDGAEMPQFIVEDADGTVIATRDVSVTGAWGEDSCTMTTSIHDVPASGFYTIRLEGDDWGVRGVKRIELEKTIEVDTADGNVVIEWNI